MHFTIQSAHDRMQEFTKARDGYGFAVYVDGMARVKLEHLTLKRFDVLVRDLESRYGVHRKEFVGLYTKKVRLDDFHDDIEFVVKENNYDS